MDRTFKAIEDVRLIIHNHGECFVVVVSAGFTFSHGNGMGVGFGG